MAELSKDVIDTIIAEAGGSGNAGITAATWAIVQRAAARGQTLDQVIRSGFDGFTNPGSGSRAAQQDPKMRANVERILSGVQSGSIPNPVPGADHFVSGNANPSWTKGMTLVGTIGGQRYYASGAVPSSAQGSSRPTPPANVAPSPATMSPAISSARLASANPALQATDAVATGGGAQGFQIKDMTGSTKGMFNYGELHNPNALVVHHTGGHPTVEGVIQTYKDRGLPAQFIIDRDGNVIRAMSETARGRHTKPSEDPNLDISNDNSWGVEIIANDDKDVTPAQKAAALGLTEYLHTTYGLPTDRVVGHGHINGHKQATEGNSVVQALRESGASVAAYANGPRPPAEIPNVVGTLTDTVPPRAVAPVTPSIDMNLMRRTTVPSRLIEDSFGQLPQRPGSSKLADSLALSPIQGGRQRAQHFDAAFDTRTGNMRLLAQPEAVSSQGLGVGTSRPPAPIPAQPSPQLAGRRATDPVLQTALNSRFPTLLPPIPQRSAVPQSQIDRGTSRTVAAAPAAKPRVTVSTPYTTPQSPIERSAARAVTQSPVGQPPATRVVQSVPMPPIPAARQPIPQSFAGMEGGAPRVAAVEERLPSTPMAGRFAAPPPVVFDPSFSTAEVTGNVGQTVRPTGPLAPIPRTTIARVPLPVDPYRAVGSQLDTVIPPLPRPRPAFGMGGVDIPGAISQTGQVAPTPMPRLQRPGIFGRPQVFGHDIPLPGIFGVLQNATMAMNNASGPFRTGADNALYNGLRGGDFNTPGAATRQAGGFLYAAKPGGGFVNVGRVNLAQSGAALYDSRTTRNDSRDDAANRVNGSSSRGSGGARSLLD